MSRESDRLRALATTPRDVPGFEPDTDDVLHRARSHQTRRRIIAAASGLSLVSVSALAGLFLLSSSQTVQRSPAGSDTGTEQSQLAVRSCEETGQPMTLTQAETGAAFLLEAHDRLADVSSTASLVGVWRCPGSEIEMRFSSGITVWEDVNNIPDPAASWKALAEQDPIDTSVSTVQGQPAALIDPAKSPGSINGSVTFVLSGTWVVVEGNGQIAIAELARVAESMRPVEPSTRIVEHGTSDQTFIFVAVGSFVLALSLLSVAYARRRRIAT